MNKFLTLFISILLSVCFISVANAKGKKGPSVEIKGDVVAQNYNWDGSATDPATYLLSHGKVSAKLKNGKASGTVRATSIFAYPPNFNLGSIDGKVVCMMELPGSVWEVRFLVTDATGTAAGLLGLFGSLFVSDGGDPGPGTDMVDENFSPPYTADCGLRVEVINFGLEPVVSGNIEVKVK